jgi:hypothetical protein
VEYSVWLVLVVCVGLSWPNPPLGEPAFSWIESKLAGLANHRNITLILISAAAILARVMLLGWLPIPQPVIHDEYSYLLAADTYAHGKLANSPHPLSIFFDTFHVIQHPTYSSIYPPMQGLALALGQLLGHPWIGVLLSTALMCVAITWMLQGWMPARWAVIGGVLVLLRFGIYTYWINSYWGGSLPAAGAALVMGAMPRLLKYRRGTAVIPFGLGVFILAMSRPVEGFVYCVPVAVAFLWSCLRHGQPSERREIVRLSLAVASVCACVAGLTLCYNWRVTKNPLVFPTAIEVKELIISPVFVWQNPKPAQTYPNPQFETFYTSTLPAEFSPGWAGTVKISRLKVIEFWRFFCGAEFSIPFVTLPWLLLDRKMRLVLAQFGISAVGMLLVVWFHPHYAAPLLANLTLLGMQGLRHLRAWSIARRPIGVSLVRLVIWTNVLIVPVNLLFFRFPSSVEYWIYQDGRWPQRYLLIFGSAALVLSVSRYVRRNPQRLTGGTARFTGIFEFGILLLAVWQICVGLRNKRPQNFASQIAPRSFVEQQMKQLPGEHLVVVRYSASHDPNHESVYNDADIDRAKTVWVREIPGRSTAPVLSYFRNRDAWIFEPDATPARLYPYASGDSEASAMSPSGQKASDIR